MIPEKYWVPILALATALIAAAVYLPSINAPFVYDDRHAIYQNPAVLGGASIKEIFTDPSAFSSRPNMRMYRPLTLLTYRLNYAVAGFRMSAWHGFHILFHAINAALLFFIALKIFDDKRIAFLTATLWVVHPLASEAVIYQSARSNLLAATAVLGGFYFYISGENSALRRGLSTIVFALGLLCKETASVLPALMLWHDSCKIASRSAPTKSNYWITYTPYAVILGAYLILRMTILRLETFHVATPVRPVWENLLTQSGAVMLYFRQALWPAGLSIEHNLVTVSSFTPLNAPMWRWPIFAIPLLVALVSRAVLARKESFALSLGIVWWFVCLIPESSIIPLVQVANERRAYLPLAGLAIAAGSAIDRLLKRRGNPQRLPLQFGQARGPAPTFALIALTLLCLITLTVDRELQWKTTSSLWSAAIKLYPDSAPAMHGLATAKGDDEGDLIGAEWLYRRIMVYDPTYYGARLGMGRLLVKRGDVQGADAQLREAIKLAPEDDAPWISLSELYLNARMFVESEQAAREAVRLNPRSPQAWNNLGSALGAQGKLDEALDAIGRAISLNPGYAIGHFNRGNVLRELGRIEEAIVEYREALRLDPNLIQARNALDLLGH